MSTVTRGTLYTLGYSQPEAAARLERLMCDPCTLLVDVRYQPRSRWYPEWNRAALSARYSERYLWESRLGNLNYQRHDLPIQLAAGYEDAIIEAAVLLCEGRSLVLLCACGDERACHRTYVASLMQNVLPVPLSCWEVRA